MELVQTIGRRKASVARANVRKGSGKIIINKKKFTDYFPGMILQSKVTQPLTIVDGLKKFDIKINVDGGGFTGQSEAVRLAIARAMVVIDPETKKALRADGLLTRDSREVERKKPGQKKARKRFQFTKR